MKELVDFVMLKSLSSQRDGNALLVHQRPMSLCLTARSLKFICLEDRVVLLKESHLVMASFAQTAFVAGNGVIMSQDDGERACIEFDFVFTRLEICGGPSCGYPFLVGLTDDG